MIRRKPRSKILVVEDDPTTLSLIKLVLRVLDFDVESAVSLKKAKDKLKYNGYNYVLLDLGLPDSQGTKTLQSIKKATQDKIIIITGLMDSKIKDECLKLGIIDFVYKGTIHSDYFEKLKEEN